MVSAAAWEKVTKKELCVRPGDRSNYFNNDASNEKEASEQEEAV